MRYIFFIQFVRTEVYMVYVYVHIHTFNPVTSHFVRALCTCIYYTIYVIYLTDLLDAAVRICTHNT